MLQDDADALGGQVWGDEIRRAGREPMPIRQASDEGTDME